jgi:hypothetical protein
MMFLSRYAIAALPLFVLVAATSKQKILGSKNGPFNADFEKLVNETLELWYVPGISIAVIDGEDTWAQVRFLTTHGLQV